MGDYHGWPFFELLKTNRARRAVRDMATYKNVGVMTLKEIVEAIQNDHEPEPDRNEQIIHRLDRIIELLEAADGR